MSGRDGGDGGKKEGLGGGGIRRIVRVYRKRGKSLNMDGIKKRLSKLKGGNEKCTKKDCPGGRSWNYRKSQDKPDENPFTARRRGKWGVENTYQADDEEVTSLHTKKRRRKVTVQSMERGGRIGNRGNLTG